MKMMTMSLLNPAEPGFPRPEPRKDGSSAPNIFTDSINETINRRGRGIRPVQRVNPFSRGRGGTRMHFLGRVRPM